ncbi:hypothetical protein Bbelb_208750 [Branchiostoma belcheri]|nr:hypothetical protein Bbelb_208750 [Branchiostoma belcheri]
MKALDELIDAKREEEWGNNLAALQNNNLRLRENNLAAFYDLTSAASTRGRENALKYVLRFLFPVVERRGCSFEARAPFSVRPFIPSRPTLTQRPVGNPIAVVRQGHLFR